MWQENHISVSASKGYLKCACNRICDNRPPQIGRLEGIRYQSTKNDKMLAKTSLTALGWRKRQMDWHERCGKQLGITAILENDLR